MAVLITEVPRLHICKEDVVFRRLRTSNTFWAIKLISLSYVLK
jgi:hypothetical protein